VCHELAHQWFGNLVTMEFWTQLWLNEGFARYMEFVAIDHLFPTWDIWTEFVQSVYGLALSLDALESSHPVEVPVQHPDEIREIFDAISYAKGASIIRMASSYIGLPKFMEGLKLYLTRHEYGNTTTEDLWNALAETSGQPMVELMTPWTSQVGYPILMLPDKSKDAQGIIQVSRFLASGPNSIAASWPIPVTAIVEGMDGIQGPWLIDGPIKDERDELLSKIEEWTLQDKWFKLNAQQCGFYHTLYTPGQWRRLAARAMTPINGPLSASDRLGLLSDSFAAGRAGYCDIVDSLRLVEVVSQHDEAGECAKNEWSNLRK
jgi:puromycin-sensitive aminopeptidase